MIYLSLTMVALVTIYIVDISGFTDSWRGLLASALHIGRMKPLPPFDCGKCMTWWACLTYSLCVGEFSLWTLAFSALLSHLSVPLGGILIFVREWMNWLINKLLP